METVSLYQLAQSLETQAQWPEAKLAYRQSCQEHPEPAIPLCQLARIHRQLGELEEARQVLMEALEKAPEVAEVQCELGLLFYQTGQLEYAVPYLQQTLRLAPQNAEAYYYLGKIFQQEGHEDKAQRFYQQALFYRKDYPEAFNALGTVALIQGSNTEACDLFHQAVSLRPEMPEYHKNLGLALFWEAQESLARDHLLTAIRLNPRLAEEYLHLGEFFARERQLSAASAFFKLALRGQGVSKAFLYNRLGELAEQTSEPEDALYYYQKALQQKPEDWWPEVRAATLLPWIYQNSAEVLSWNQRYSQNLDYLFLQLNYLNPENIPPITQFSQNFLLAYQGVNNRVLYERLAQFWQVLLPKQPPLLRAKPRSGKTGKIGFISAHFYKHPITECFGQLIIQLAQAGFDVSCIQIATPHQDSTTAEIASKVQHYFNFSSETQVDKLAERIRKMQFDLLIYPEVGLENLTYLLSLLRLAPIQAVLAGHPVTTGSATIDYFISCSLFEPPQAENHYAEKLYCTQTPAVTIPKPIAPRSLLSRAELGLPEDRHIYLIPETLFKLHPDFDLLLKGILASDPKGTAVLIKHKYYHWHQKLLTRFETSLGQHQEQVLFLDWTDQERFFMRLLQADAVLDSLYFGAGTVAYQALGLGIPLVTLPGAMMRGRIVAGLYHQMGIRDCWAQNQTEYVQIACRLANQPEWRKAISEKIRGKNARLFHSNPGVQELIHFFRTLLSPESPQVDIFPEKDQV
ncbi:MAG: tetratricopeptide repeat protein [Candidatus Sericytochromatia bacterium]